ncbi:mitochondrial import protein Pam17 [Cristinia sonorae]|uniref:Presequence translocated-associated motor subunit PAM17 n=1 Tax=Cristinia sonorae TaxID=1940300 RepID=A0A8K0ULJ3_9AGAR|nr:mitochondrial import protein Pam17 [Cristinia sonorae]
MCGRLPPSSVNTTEMSNTLHFTRCRSLARPFQISVQFRTAFSSRPRANVSAIRQKSSSAKAAAETVKQTENALKKGPAPSKAEQESLPWGQYLTIRKNKRRWETIVTIPTTILGFTGGIMYFGSQEMDPTKPIFNIDPMVVYAVATLGCAGLGYLVGPVIGSYCWRLSHRRTMSLIEARDRQFHRHIVKNRADPTAQSATNPVPDYYGEKIGSISEYRQWLRDQAKYKKKAFLPED